MSLYQEIAISCPHCGEPISILADGSVEEQQYTEDCEVWCSPMDLRVSVLANGGFQVDVRREND